MELSIALIGGTGFIGTNLTHYFLNKGYKVLVVSRNLSTKIEGLQSDNLKSLVIDVNYTSKLVESLEEYSNILWLVNDLLPSVSLDSLVDDFSFNIKPLIDFLESTSKLKKLKKFIYLSSGGTIYGNSPSHELFVESSKKQPISAYGLSKIVAENYIEFITNRADFESFILRPSNIYGNFQNLIKPQGIIGYAFNSILRNTPIELFNDGKVTRDFLHVLDLAAAIQICIESSFENSKVEVYNIGSQKGYTIKNILDLISKITGKEIPIIPKPARIFDCEYNVLDINKFSTSLNWHPKIDIENGLNQVWLWFKAENKV